MSDTKPFIYYVSRERKLLGIIILLFKAGALKHL